MGMKDTGRPDSWPRLLAFAANVAAAGNPSTYRRGLPVGSLLDGDGSASVTFEPLPRAGEKRPRHGPRRLLTSALAATVLIAGSHRPSSASSVTDAAIRQSIEAVAAQDLRLENTQVSARVSGGEVILFGQVRLYRQKMLYEQIAWQVAGVAEVDNEIRVEPTQPVAAADLERQVLRIIQDQPRFRGSGINVAVANGHVRLAGLFDEPSDVLFLKHKVAELEGVVGIEIEPRFKV